MRAPDRRAVLAAAAALGVVAGAAVAATGAGASSTLAPLPGTTTTAVAVAQGGVLRLGADGVLRANALSQQAGSFTASTTTTEVRRGVEDLLDAHEDRLVVAAGSQVQVVDRTTGAVLRAVPRAGVQGAQAAGSWLLLHRDGPDQVVDVRTGATTPTPEGSSLAGPHLVRPDATGRRLERVDLDTGAVVAVHGPACDGARGGVSGAWSATTCADGSTTLAEAGSTRGGRTAEPVVAAGDGVVVGARGGRARLVDLTTGATTDLGAVPYGPPADHVVALDEAGRVVASLAADGAVRVTTAVPVVDSPDERAYRSSAGALGAELDLPRVLRDGTAEWPFASGGVYTRDGASTVVTGDHWRAFQAQDGATGWLGTPRTTASGLRDGGSLVHYAGGSTYRSATSGTHAVAAAPRARWAQTGWEGGSLGYPTGSTKTVARGGTATAFQKGSIHWSPATGAHDTSGPVRSRWARTGWERGPLGYPTSDPITLAGGAVLSRFQGGNVYWTRATGAHEVTGATLARYGQLGWENGRLGYPTGPTKAVSRGGTATAFQGGSIHWSPATGAHDTSGPVRSRWAATGWERGPLGYPTSDPITLAGGGVLSRFQGGNVYWTRATGAHEVTGPTLVRYGQLGWENGRLGYPTSGPQPVAGGVRTDFQGGSILQRADGKVFTTLRR
ncbi:hypothetical protein WDZ16_03985 [Pseudokineococcus marinus]|uniref:LGFP repeat-containing protein n=1 Tax=Pseudokineococcus marinus TaxID=351215 RepID=A0A849BPP6_9ACTN|nr:hypothetical protein [Pseudokineococcus marinus]NNH22802.1 hypothetical protein [Pseudokineococcus marinus]